MKEANLRGRRGGLVLLVLWSRNDAMEGNLRGVRVLVLVSERLRRDGRDGSFRGILGMLGNGPAGSQWPFSEYCCELGALIK